MSTRQAVHELVDELSEQALPEAKRALEEIRGNGSFEVDDTESQQESALARAEALGLVGCVDGGPGDLATNPRHMVGYGE